MLKLNLGAGGVRRTKWIVELAPAPRWAQVQLAMAQSAALALPEPTETVDAETGEIVEPAQLPAPASAPDPRPMPTTLSEAYKQGHQDGVKAPAPTTTANVPSPVKPASTNGNGSKPAAAAPKKTFTLKEVEEVWTARWQTALKLKLQPEAIQGSVPVEEFMERCKALRKQILERANLIVNTHPSGKINVADSDEQIIAQAISLAATWETVNVPA